MTQKSFPHAPEPGQAPAPWHGPTHSGSMLQPGPQEPPRQGAAGTLSTVALVVGVVALVSSLIPVVGVIGIFVGVVALILGLIAAFVERSRGRAITAMVLGAIAVPLGLVITLATGGAIANYFLGPNVQAEVASASALLDEDEFADDDCLSVDFDQPAGNSVDYTVSNTCDHTTPAAVFVVDAIDGNGHVIASGWGDAESLDTSGRSSTYESYVVFDDDVTRAASFEIRDLDANNALAETWWYGEDATIEA